MKRITTMMICLSMLLVLGACGEEKVVDSPKVVTAAFLDAYNKHDEEKIKEYSQWTDYSIKALQIQESDYIDGVEKTLQKDVYEMMQSFDHKEGKETMNEDIATVNVTLSIYNFEPVIKEGLKNATKKAEELSKQENITDAKAQAEINTVIFQNLKKAKKTISKDIEVNLIKVDGKWMVSNDNADIQNVLITNMQSFQNIAE